MKTTFTPIWKDRKRTFLGLPISFTRYYLTEKKFISSVGFFSLKEDEIDLYRITDKRLQLGFWQRIFGCGTIVLLARDVDTPEKIIKSIKHPREVLDLFDEKIAEQRRLYRIEGRDMIGAAGEVPLDADFN
ncbi:MAG: PH domain-containing protein [Oscillospiraceae bacterium]|jgi:hypothetical protein|nr:PH domain-containing protein [Oscillospiraceae bacterium]